MDAPTPQVIVHPDLMTLVRNHLLEQLPRYHGQQNPTDATTTYDTEQLGVVVEIPEPRPERFIWLGRNGGVEDSQAPILEYPRLDMQGWGLNQADAHDHFMLARGLVLAMANVGPIRRVKSFTGPRWDPDESKRPRLLGSFEFMLRGRVIEPPQEATP